MLFASVLVPLFASMAGSALAHPLPEDLYDKVSCELAAFFSLLIVIREATEFHAN
jgi:hypothetical protein